MAKIEFNDLLVNSSETFLVELPFKEQEQIFGGSIPQVVPCTSDLPPGHWGSPCVGSGGSGIKTFTWYTKIA